MRVVIVVIGMLYLAMSAYFAVRIMTLKETPMQSLKEFIDILFSRGNLLSNFISAILCGFFVPAYIIVMIAALFFKIFNLIESAWNWWVKRNYL